ncbi:ABC transporter ATP-binding protein [Polaromonas sp. AER18D-145]|uniref:ABC transporter ATP-binding protein n=1 Tax=Polaromonas sp. AER18D-145 TaxID=1977060 RepID=UPI000BBC4EF4|nr:ATP-binding cassette domain-containing protein [Polaromonas sp. AER18D-145]
MTAPVLETRGLTLAYGRFLALRNVDLQLLPGQRYGVLGPNGAGKTTLLNLLTGTLTATSGSIHLDGTDITALSAERRSHLGIGRSFQKTSVFPEFSVLENVRLAVQSRELRRSFDFWTPRSRDRHLDQRAMAYVEKVGLAAKAAAPATALSYGELRQLEIALALATEPRLLLLDEPTAGMSEEETHAVVDMLRASLPRALTLVIIEHDLKVIEGLTDHVFVFEQGALFEQGTPNQIRDSARVQEIYFKGRHLD